ncbi:hypothetical protein LK536_07555 [Lachnoclostridium pacaense]|uniref:hypothetical protein n=1 Tax=Enterocloster hominis (ex Hitch et al. 2024) TaxID=1917870 RepID=UPI001D125982|nr:hypothetical protein [Lachnoclostridium pacaense]MCC2876131.1 hypothetical protein [Lachnoclostridium pacaense]
MINLQFCTENIGRTPFVFNKETGDLRQLETDIDFHCRICAYDAEADRIIMVGTSYAEAEYLREKWNGGQVMQKTNNTYYPPDTYIFELIQNDKLNLLLKLEDFEIKNIGVKGADEITYSGYALKHANIPMENYLYKTGSQPQIADLFGGSFPLTIYDEYVYESKDTILFIGSGEGYAQGIYRYCIANGEIELIYDGTDFHNAYVNNFMLLR